jgi:hypothetical protein
MAAYYVTWTRDGKVYTKTHTVRREAVAHHGRLEAEGAQVTLGRWSEAETSKRYVERAADQMRLAI